MICSLYHIESIFTEIKPNFFYCCPFSVKFSCFFIFEILFFANVYYLERDFLCVFNQVCRLDLRN